MPGSSPGMTSQTMEAISASRHELAAELVLDVNPDDVLKVLLGGGEAEFAGAGGVEIARPAVDDTDDKGIGLALDARGDLLARNALQGRDLLADRSGKPRHGEIAARPNRCQIHSGGMLEKTDGRA